MKETKGRSERNERKRESIEGEGIRVKRRRKIPRIKIINKRKKGKKMKVSIFYIFFFLRKNFFIDSYL